MLKLFEIKTDRHDEPSTFYRKTMDEAKKCTVHGKILDIKEIKPIFKSTIRFSKDEECYHFRFEKFSGLLLKAHPGIKSIEFTSRGIYAMRPGFGPSIVYGCSSSKELLAFIDGYWETDSLLFNIKSITI